MMQLVRLAFIGLICGSLNPALAQTIIIEQLPDINHGRFDPGYQGAIHDQTDPDFYGAEFARSRKAKAIFKRVFGKRFSAPLAARAKFEAPEEFPPSPFDDAHQCSWLDCLEFGDQNSFVVYRSRVDNFRHLMALEAGQRAYENCDVQQKWPCTQALEAMESSYLGKAPRLSLNQEFWIEAFEGAAISWETLTPDDKEGRADMLFAQKLALRATPDDCADFVGQTGVTIAAACGRILRHDTAKESTIYYCLQQRLPGLDDEARRCIPLYRTKGEIFQVATLAGQIVEEIGGDIYSASCSFDSALSLQQQANILSQSFRSVINQDLMIERGANDSFRLGAASLNADFSKITRHKPWAFVKIGFRLKRNGMSETEVVTSFSYTLSPRRMTSRSEAKEPTEEESGRIAYWLGGQLNAAISKLGPRNKICDVGGFAD